MRCAIPPPPSRLLPQAGRSGAMATETMLQPMGGIGSSAGVQARKEDAGESTGEEEKARQGGEGDMWNAPCSPTPCFST